MEFINVLGWTATILFTVCYIPQILKILRTQTVDGLSFRLLFISFIANIIAFYYAVLIKQPPLQIKYVLALFFLSICLYLYLKVHFRNLSNTGKDKYIGKEFATAINCIDGRVQKPVAEYIQKSFNVDYVDMITEPGPNKILSECKDVNVIEFLKKKVKISVEKHNSQIIAVTAHYDCAGNPENEDAQKEQLRKAISVITSWGFPVKKIIALWLDENFKPSIIS